MTSISIPNSVTSIGDLVFYQCNNLTTIKSELENPFEIGSNTFSSYTTATLIVPVGTRDLYKSTAGWSGFPNVVEFGEGGVVGMKVEVDGVYYNIGENNTVSLTSNNSKYSGDFEIPNQVTYNGKTYVVTSIGVSAFYYCSGLTSVTIPNSVTSIGNSAFQGCSSLTFITIPNSVTSIGSYTFYGCSSINSVTIPNSVNTIGSYAFYECSGLTSVIIGSGVTSIGGSAFYGTNLKKTIWLTNTPPTGYGNVSGALNYVSNDKFTSLYNTIQYQFLSSYFDVDGVRYVPVKPSEKTCDAIDCVYNESASDIKIASTVVYKGVSMNVKKIQPYLCFNNKYVEKLEIETEGSIGQYSFYGCSNLKSAILGNRNINISDDFSGIFIGDNITSIGNFVFYDCTKLDKVIISDREGELSLESNESSPLFSSCPLDYVYIGGNINYNKTSNYGYSPFYRNTSLRAVEITDKETEISDNEFYGCTNLERVTIGDGITAIGNWAFSGCQSLKYFAFGSQVATIGQEAFSDCAAVTEIISKAATPPVCGTQALDDINKWDCKLYVPDGCMAAYEAADQWMDFFFKEEGEGTATQNPEGQPETGKCEKPTITIADGKIHFTCATEGVTYTYHITATDPSGVGNDIAPSSLTLTVYASKPGYENSDAASIEIAASAGVFGDLTGDGKVDVADHVKLSSIIMEQSE